MSEERDFVGRAKKEGEKSEEGGEKDGREGRNNEEREVKERGK